jgi:Putative transposase/Transposase zinc-binding domain
VDVADIFRAAWPGYLAKFGRLIPPEQHAAARAIQRCRTPALGGQLYRCDCGHTHFTYHSCNHRACPKCGYDDNALWLARQLTRLLPVPYFLVTFTVPEPLRQPIRSARKLWYGALLRESAGALQDIAAQPKYLGAQLGLLCVLQTWTRDLRYHPHVHLLVPGAGLSSDGLRWKRLQNPAFLFPQNKLAARFKGRLKAWLQKDHPRLLAQVPAKVWWMDWVPDVQAVGSGAAALKYLAAYLHRGPLHPARIQSWSPPSPHSDAARAGSVTFRYRDRHGQEQPCTLTGQEFIRRCLQHVPPPGFQRVRHYGWLAAAASAQWQRILALLDWRPPRPQLSATSSPPILCPGCRKPMRLIGTLPRQPP